MDLEQNKQNEEINVDNDLSRLESFDDLSGVSVKNLEHGLWWVKNRKFFQRTLFWFIVILGGLCWLYTLGSFGYYIAFGMRQDDLMARQLTESGIINHNQVTANLAAPLVLSDVQLLPSAPGRYDFAIQVANPNPRHHVTISYVFLVDGVETEMQTNHILPGEEKIVAYLGKELANAPDSVKFIIKNEAWERLNSKAIPDWKSFYEERYNFTIIDSKFLPAKLSGLSEKLSVGQIIFSIRNNSAYSFYRTPVMILLYRGNSLVGASKTILDRFNSGETRAVTISYSGQTDRVEEIRIVPEVNILNPETFLRPTGGILE